MSRPLMLAMIVIVAAGAAGVGIGFLADLPRSQTGSSPTASGVSVARPVTIGSPADALSPDAALADAELRKPCGAGPQADLGRRLPLATERELNIRPGPGSQRRADHLRSELSNLSGGLAGGRSCTWRAGELDGGRLGPLAVYVNARESGIALKAAYTIYFVSRRGVLEGAYVVPGIAVRIERSSVVFEDVGDGPGDRITIGPEGLPERLVIGGRQCWLWR